MLGSICIHLLMVSIISLSSGLEWKLVVILLKKVINSLTLRKPHINNEVRDEA